MSPVTIDQLEVAVIALGGEGTVVKPRRIATDLRLQPGGLVQPQPLLSTLLVSPWRLSAADKAAVAACIVLPLGSLYIVWEWRFLQRPALAPYIDQAFLPTVFAAHLAMLTGWAGVLLAALILRRRAPNNGVIVHALVQLYAIGFSMTSYWIGHHTAGYMAAVVMGGVIVGFTFFDRIPVLMGVATILLVIVGTTIAEQAGIIPYAPLMATAPIVGRHLATSWLTSYAAATFVVVIVVAGLVYHISYRLRDSEDALARAGEQLARANELISRYVAAQVAEQILAGNYAAVNQHTRRRLTFFFSDVVGFTDIAERLEPEDVSQLLNDYFSAMSIIADRHGGTVDKFIGDAVVILFGAPIASAEHEQALGAVRMALEMQGAVAHLQETWLAQGIDVDFRVRMGINTGVATVGNFGSSGRMDYTAIGRQVNLASRLQAGCAPGRIAISHPTWLLVHDQIACVAQGEIAVKGIQQPVKVYEVAGEV